MKQFWHSARLSISLLVVLHLAVVLAGFLGPDDPAKQNRKSALLAPMNIHFLDSRSKLHFRPFVTVEGEDRPLRFFVSGSPYRLLGLFRLRTHLFGLDQPSGIHLLGTDEFGRDQFSRVLWGGQISLATGWLAAVISVGLGMLLGLTAGFWGGWRDSLIMRGAELFLALPWLYLLLAVRAFLPLSLSPGATALVLIAVIGGVGWARPARLVRGVTLSAKERDYVYAARGFGASAWYLATRHCLRETYSVIATQAALLIPQYILAEVTLSFIGLGVGEPVASWGNLLAPLRQFSIITSAWWMALPALIVVLTSWCFLRLEDALGNASQRKHECEKMV
jgi:peptide/nickel transport system permease protein